MTSTDLYLENSGPFQLPFEKRGGRIYFFGVAVLSTLEQLRMLDSAISGKKFNNNQLHQIWSELQIPSERNAPIKGYCASHGCSQKKEPYQWVRSFAISNLSLYNCQTCLAYKLCEARKKHMIPVVIDYGKSTEVYNSEDILSFDGKYKLNDVEISGFWEQMESPDPEMLKTKFVVTSEIESERTGLYICRLSGYKLCDNYLRGTCKNKRVHAGVRNQFLQESVPLHTPSWIELIKPGCEGKISLQDECIDCMASIAMTPEDQAKILMRNNRFKQDNAQLRSLNADQKITIDKLKQIIMDLHIQLLECKKPNTKTPDT